jgi:hypothetical protein
MFTKASEVLHRVWGRWAAASRGDRGDVPGWVLITLVNRV